MLSHYAIFEFDCIVESTSVVGYNHETGVLYVHKAAYDWLEKQCLQTLSPGQTKIKPWVNFSQVNGKRGLKVTNYVGVVQTPNGTTIEILPKVGKTFFNQEIDDQPSNNNLENSLIESRTILLKMLLCLQSFRHITINPANLLSAKMPLLEIFIAEFLGAVEHIVKRGLRSQYNLNQDNLFVLKGKLLIAEQVRKNLLRPDRFFTEHDVFNANRPENRLLHAALQRVGNLSKSQKNIQLIRKLNSFFEDVPVSTQVATDFQKVKLDRGMGYYSNALAWARIILNNESLTANKGDNNATSLLFPMEAVFEAYVAKHLAKQIRSGYTLKTQAKSQYLVQHEKDEWFQLKPDLLIQKDDANKVVLDTKWKLLDSAKANGTDKYNLSGSDFYQMLAYATNYLTTNSECSGTIILIYPKTKTFDEPLPVFEFNNLVSVNLFVLPFCLEEGELLLSTEINSYENIFC